MLMRVKKFAVFPSRQSLSGIATDVLSVKAFSEAPPVYKYPLLACGAHIPDLPKTELET
jgi:hypothetical protein